MRYTNRFAKHIKTSATAMLMLLFTLGACNQDLDNTEDLEEERIDGLADTELETGTSRHIRPIPGDTNYVVIDGEQHDLMTPSAQFVK